MKTDRQEMKLKRYSGDVGRTYDMYIKKVSVSKTLRLNLFARVVIQGTECYLI